MKKKLVICPNCQERGRIEILGEVKNGSFLVLRKRKVSKNVLIQQMTKIIGSDFAVVCGVCKEPVYIRKEQDEVRHKWFKRVSWNQVTGTLGGSITT